MASDKGIKVNVFLMGNAVYVARKGQNPPANLPNLEEMVVDLIEKGVGFLLCTTCVNARGFEPKEGEVASCFVDTKESGLTLGDFIEGTQLSTMNAFINLVAESDKVISF